MILQALTNHYEALAAKGVIPRDGWAGVKVYYSVDFNDQGEFLRLSPLRETREVIQKGKKKLIIEPQIKTVPEHMKRSGKNPPPYFLCDNIKYVLGITGGSVNETSLKYNRVFLNHNMMMLDGMDDPVINSFVRLLKGWDPHKAIQNPYVRKYLDEFEDNYNIVFRHESGVFVHDLPVVSELVAQSLGDDTKELKGFCLITGKKSSIARVHNSFKGIYSKNPPSNGFTLVGFNMDSVLSFGKTQSYNAPVSKYAAFAYTTALNHLLADTAHRKFIGDATVVYWAENSESAEQDFMSALFDGGDERITDEVLDDTMKRFATGQSVNIEGLMVSPDDRFFLLALSPNNARVSVRFFYDTSFGDIARNFKRFYDELEITGAKKFIPLWQMLNETARKTPDGKANPSPEVSGDMLRAVITGSDFPETFYQSILLRIRSEKEIRAVKAAAIKAFLLRNRKNHPDFPKYKEVLSVKLNEETAYLPYVLGELFAVLEAVQETASNVTTIKDRFFTSACTTPAVVFPRLIELANHHLRKMDGGTKVFYAREIGTLMTKIGESYPAQMNLNDQGIFQIGYYHKRQKRFERKTQENKVEE